MKVVIVPAGGIHSTDINDAIRSFLQHHAMPGVQVTVEDCKKNLFNLTVTVRVKTDAFVVNDVEKEVISKLKDYFKLKNRKLGEHVYLSEVYKVVESVQGVENSICVLNDDSTLQLVRAENESSVVYLDTEAGSSLEVTHEKYRP